jgi:hypothetical protein
MRAKGSTDDARKNARGSCSVEGCERPHQAKGLCENHWRQERQKRLRREAREAEARVCAYCETPIPDGRRIRGPISYCSRDCKNADYVLTGRNGEACTKSYFKTKYGLTMAQVDELRSRPCDICGTIEWSGRHKQAHIDHDHATGKVRGVLCSECNVGLGKFGDDIGRLRAAIAYLERAETVA